MKLLVIPLRVCILFIIPVLLSACYSKSIYVTDSTGTPIPDVLIAAYQQNILFYNSKSLFRTDKNGMTSVPFSGMVQIYAGKRDYEIEIIGVTDSKTSITLKNIKGSTYKRDYIAHLKSDSYKIPPENLWLEWVDYIEWLEKERQFK